MAVGGPAQIRAVVVPVGVSGFGHGALPVAAFLARTLDVRVEIVLVEVSEDARHVERSIEEIHARLGPLPTTRTIARTCPANDFAHRCGGPDRLVCLAPTQSPLRWIAKDVLRTQRQAVLVGPQVRDVNENGTVLALLNATPGDREVLDVSEAWARALRRPRVATCVSSDGRAGPSADHPWATIERLTGRDVVRAFLGFERSTPATLMVVPRSGGLRSFVRPRGHNVQRLVAASRSPVLAISAGRAQPR